MSQLQEIFFSVGALAAIVSAVMTALGWRAQGNLAGRARRADYLRAQIQNLYGPLAYYLEAAHRAWDLHEKVRRGYEEYYRVQKRERFEGEAKQIIAVQNLYADRILALNKEAAAVVKANWGALDSEDLEAVGSYLAEIERHEVETSGEKAALPTEFYFEGMMENALGSPIPYRMALVERFRSKLIAKQAELAGLKKIDVPKLPSPGEPKEHPAQLPAKRSDA